MKKYIIIDLEHQTYFSDSIISNFTANFNLAQFFETESAANDKAMKLPTGIYEIKEVFVKD